MSRKKKEKRYTVTVAFKDNRHEIFPSVKSIGGADDTHFLIIVSDTGFIMYPKEVIACVRVSEE